MAFVLYGIYEACAALARIRLHITCHGDERLTVKSLSHNATYLEIDINLARLEDMIAVLNTMGR